MTRIRFAALFKTGRGDALPRHNDHARGRELVELASSHFPSRELEVTGDENAWPLMATAMLKPVGWHHER
jgi:hypothetical protein